MKKCFVYLALWACSISNVLAITYTYDSLNRLVAVVYDDGKRIDYDYDPTGNITKMAFAAGSPNGNDVVLLQASSPSTVGAGAGDDTYVLAPNTLTSTTSLTLSDTQGSNLLQLAAGLSIAKSEVAPTALRLNMNNGAKVVVLGADAFQYDVGGNATVGINHAPVSFSDFAKNTLGVAVPASGIVTGGPVTIPNP
ncbi:exported hypothetical protein [Gammaproteobacteria bacterium]